MQEIVNVILGVEQDSETVKRAKEVAEPVGQCDVLDVQKIVNVILE